MRIGHLAAAAGTTARAVRHYHRLGLMAEPPRLSNGYRDYSMADLARLMRIRWLADSGVPLEGVSSVLAGPEHGDAADGRDTDAANDVRADLADLVDRSSRQLAVAQRRHERLVRMLEAADAGRPLSPLPPELVAVLDSAMRDIGRDSGPGESRALAADRGFLEVLAISGHLPNAIIEWYTRVLGTAELRQRYRSVMRDWGRLEGRSSADVQPEISDLSARISEWIVEDPIMLSAMGFGHLPEAENGDMLGGIAVVDLAQVQLTSAEVISDPAQREVFGRVLRRLARGPKR